MADEIASTWKSLLTELGHAAQVTEHGVPDVCRGGGKVGFIEGTSQKSTSGQDDIPRARASTKEEND
jgi:hypothetical protein